MPPSAPARPRASRPPPEPPGRPAGRTPLPAAAEGAPSPLSGLGGDLRYALRALARAKTYTAAAILCLALGVGANTAIFSAVSAVLLRPVPTPWVDGLVVVRDDAPLLGLRQTEVAPAEAMDIAARRDLFRASTAYAPRAYNLTEAGEPRRVTAAATLGDFFGVFGARPHLGGLYRPADSRGGDPHQVVLSHAFWQSLTGGDERVVGRTLLLDGAPHRVVGVLRPGFAYPRAAQLYVPFAYEARHDRPQERGTLIMTAVSRLRPDVSLERAQAGLREEARRWHARFAHDFKYEAVGHTLVVIPFADSVAGPLRTVLLVLMGSVGLVLLIACANVASLQLVRGTGRAREVAVRAALGAPPSRLARPLLVESALVAAAGGALGLVLGGWLMRVLAHSAPASYGALREVRLDGRVLAFTAAAALVCGVLFGVFPALFAARTQPLGALKEDARGASGGRRRNRALGRIAGVQTALATLMLLASGLLLRSLGQALAAEPGFRPEGVATASLSLPEGRYPGTGAAPLFFGQLLERLRTFPGVRAVGLTSAVPLSGEGDSSPIRRVDGPASADGPPGHANMHTVSEGYFRAIGIPLLRGRLFEPADDELSPRVVVVDEQFAKQYFPGEDPIGRRIEQGRVATIVGVVGTVSHRALGEPPKAATYYSYRQNPWIRAMSVVAWAPGDAAGSGAALRRAVGEADPTLAVYDVLPLAERVRGSLAPLRFAAGALSGFAALSLLLTVLGIYGVLSYTTAQRERELGIRMALGATPGEVVRLVLAGGLRLAAAGVAVGVVLFLVLGRLLAGLVYGVQPRDPVTVVAGAALVAAVAAAASWLPARRAAAAAPAQALRAE